MPKMSTHDLSTLKTFDQVPRKKLWSFLGVWCWKLPMTGCQVTMCMLRRLCACS